MRKFLLIASLAITLNATVVTDEDTGLMWQDNNDAKTLEVTYSDAIKYCQNLSISGYSDWRLPNIDELISITDKRRHNPSIKKIFKNVTTRSYYWTITKSKWSSAEAWIVAFDYGFDYHYSLSNKNYVRCVR